MNEPTQDRPDEQLSHQPPYDEARYARYQPEPWDDDAPQVPDNAKRVWYGFIAFACAVMAFGGMLVLLGIISHTNPQMVLDSQKQSWLEPQFENVTQVKDMARTYLLIGSIYIVAFGAIFFFPRNLYKWGYGILLILFSAISCCFTPFALVMLIFWLLPSTRQYFQNQG